MKEEIKEENLGSWFNAQGLTRLTQIANYIIALREENQRLREKKAHFDTVNKAWLKNLAECVNANAWKIAGAMMRNIGSDIEENGIAGE